MNEQVNEPVNGVLDLATKIVGLLAAVLATAGYVLVLGAAILWLRLQEVELPPEVPVSLAKREELIAIGAQAVAVWTLLVAALGGIAAWIVTGDPERRRFGYVEAGLALAVTVSTLLVLDIETYWLLALPGLAALIAGLGGLGYWPSGEAVTAVMLPVGVGAALAVAISLVGESGGMATVVGASSVFGALVLLTPRLQQWRVRQEANRAAVARIKAEHRGDEDGELEGDPLVEALERGPGRGRPPVILWIRRAAIATVALVVLGVVAVASQIDRDENFHKALVSLTNGDCLEGAYVIRGANEIVIAQPRREDEGPRARLVTIPSKEVLEVQVYGDPLHGSDQLNGVKLYRDGGCADHRKAVLVSPAKSGGDTKPPDGGTAPKRK